MKRILHIFLCLLLAAGLLGGCASSGMTAQGPIREEVATTPTLEAILPAVDTTPATTAPTEETQDTTPATTEADNSVWKADYVHFLRSFADEYGSSYTFRLFYLDGDTIPEIAAIGSCEADGCLVASWQDGQVHTVHLSRLGGASYIPGDGLIYNCNGNMGYYSTYIYSLTPYGFECLFYGMEILQEEHMYNTGEELYRYYLDYNSSREREVTEEEYYAAQKSLFDRNQGHDLDGTTYDLSRMIEEIERF